jgi:hypothetical protein
LRTHGRRREAGKDLEQLGHGPSDDRDVLDLIGSQRRALLAGAERNQIAAGRDHDLLGLSAHRQLDLANASAIAHPDLDSGISVGLKPGNSTRRL